MRQLTVKDLAEELSKEKFDVRRVKVWVCSRGEMIPITHIDMLDDRCVLTAEVNDIEEPEAEFDELMGHLEGDVT